jgi:hypothetical protein
MSINGTEATFIPFTISGLTDITASNSNIGNATATSLTLTTATPNKIARFNGSQQLVSATVDVSDLVPYSGAAGNVNLGSNTLTANKIVAPTTETDLLKIMSAGDDYSLAVNANNLEIKNLTTNLKVYTDGESLWAPGRLTAGEYVGTVDTQLTGSQYFRYGTATQFSEGININDNYQVSDDTGSAVLELSKTTGATVSKLNITSVPSATPTLALGVNGSGGVVSFAVPSATNLLPLNNTWTGTNTYTAPINIDGCLLTPQTPSGVSASTFTTTGLPSGVPTGSTLSGTYVLTAGVASSAMGMLLGGYTYTGGNVCTFTFTNMYGSTALNFTVRQFNSAGTTSIQISDIQYSITTSPATIYGSFAPDRNPSYTGAIVFYFQAGVFKPLVSFSTFAMNTNTITINSSVVFDNNYAGIPAYALGLGGGNKLVSYAVSPFSGSVGAGYVPYASSANVFANSALFQSSSNIGIGTTNPTQKLQVAGRGCFGYIPSSKKGIFIDNEDAYGTIPCIQGVDSAFGTSAIVINPAGGNVGIGEFSPVANFQVRGTASVCGGNNYANTQGYMALGSLTLGATNKNYGGGSSWSGNTAGLMFECQDNTEIAVHDSGDRVVSFLYYAGNRLNIGRDMGWGQTPAYFHTYVNITQTNGNVLQLGNSPNGCIYFTNPNGQNTHFGYPSGGGSDNYIRGTQTYIDTPLQISNSSITFSGGLPEQTVSTAWPIMFNGATLMKGQIVQRSLYNSNSVGWGGGINITYAFFNYNGISNVYLTGKYSAYWGSAYTGQLGIRLYSQNQGAYYYYYVNTFTNNGGNHVTIPLCLFVGNLGYGWWDVYIYNNGGLNTDGNDQLVVQVQTFPSFNY